MNFDPCCRAWHLTINSLRDGSSSIGLKPPPLRLRTLCEQASTMRYNVNGKSGIKCCRVTSHYLDLHKYMTDSQRQFSLLPERGNQCGACQRSCRLCYAAVADSFCAFTAAATSVSRSGLSVTTVIACQLRVCLVQRLGLAARAQV